MKLAIGLALLALLAAVGWVLARPKWRWERPVEVAEWCFKCRPPHPPQDPHREPLTFDADIWARYSTGSPWSVTSRADNGTGLFV